MSERHSMRKIREVLRLKYDRGLSHRQISTAAGISRSSVSEYVKRAECAGLTWEIAQELSDAEAEGRLFVQVGRNEPQARAPIDFGWVHRDLHRAGVTLQLLWTEYQEAVAKGPSGQRPYQYSQFCDLYREYRTKIEPSMRQVHRAGEKAFVDYSGKKPCLVDATTGEVVEVELFVMVLGASNYTYAEATRTQTLEDFVGATTRGLEFFGAVPEMLVPDQLKSAVTKSDRYEPDINATYAEMAQHYSTAIVPARPRKPRDKAKVEGGVLIAQRWILACLRNRSFFSLEELNAALWELLEKLNHRPFKKLEGCRRSAFESIDLPAMMALPPRRYEVGRWKLGVGVNIDYHLEYEHRYYSVPCELANEKVDVRATAQVVEVWRNTVRITSHERSYGPKGTAVTKPEHRPRAHREMGSWPPERLIAWAGKTGPGAAGVVGAILARGPHPESGQRACLGLLRMGDRYGSERLEAACVRATAIGNPTYKSVKAILKSGLDKVAPPSVVEAPAIDHENIRGGDYFDRGETASPSSDEIEARYLEEERSAIMNPFEGDPIQAPSGREEPQTDAPRHAVQRAADLGAPAPPVGALPALPALLGGLKTLWSRPRAPEHGERQLPRRCHDRAEGILFDPRGSPPCMEPGACIPSVGHDGHGNERHENHEEVNRREDVQLATCPADEMDMTPFLILGKRRNDDRRDD
jgi:transposase